MTRAARLLALLTIAAAATAIMPPGAMAVSPDGISRGALYHDGPDNRYLLGGDWLFRLDNEGVGETQAFQRQTSTAGWTTTKVPYAWNAGDDSVESMRGSVGWYRKDFRLPSTSRRYSWVVRFESVNYRARVWLNGKQVGTNTGAYLPFEVRLPAGLLRRGGRNRLVVRADSRRLPTDFPPSGTSTSGLPSGGWWNYGGLLREAYLERVDGVDLPDVRVQPRLSCRACAASVEVRATVRNVDSRTRRIAITGRYGSSALALGTRSVRPGRSATFTDRIRIAKPRLWGPGHPSLYRVRLTVRAEGRKVIGYDARSGIRSIKVVNGRIVLNGKPVSFRGVGIHEDDPKVGFAIDNARRKQIVDQAKELGATVLRTHYPLHPYIQELADKAGILVWSEIPVYSVASRYMRRASVRRRAVDELRRNIIVNRNHPSVMLWSIGNELSSTADEGQSAYIAEAVSAAKRLDPTRPVALVAAGYPSAGCQAGYGPLDVVGINEYFGWYVGPGGQIADRETLSGYLDAVRACYPDKGIVITEFGAEANRAGPSEEKGTYAYQQDFVRYHLGVYATKPWLSGAIYWALQEFRVKPGWEGGNPRPNPPLHQKGLLDFAGNKKPAWADARELFAATDQYGASK